MLAVGSAQALEPCSLIILDHCPGPSPPQAGCVWVCECWELFCDISVTVGSLGLPANMAPGHPTTCGACVRTAEPRRNLRWSAMNTDEVAQNMHTGYEMLCWGEEIYIY